jgi:hypothetical protein
MTNKQHTWPNQQNQVLHRNAMSLLSQQEGLAKLQ